MMTNSTTWQTMDDVLEAKNDGGQLIAPILFKDGSLPTLEEMEGLMQGFDRVLVFETGERTGVWGNARVTRVLIHHSTPDHSVTVPIDLRGEYEVVGVNADLNYIIEGDQITIFQPHFAHRRYTTLLGFFGEDWTEIFIVTLDT
jgi:hypothetical protein